MSGPGYFARVFVVLTLLALIGDRGQCLGASEEEPSRDEDDLVPTYRSGIEKLLEGLSNVFGGGSSSSGSSEESTTKGGIGKFISSHMPGPIKKILAPVENITARGFGDVLNLVEDKFHAIFPGTRWCGDGNIASSEEDVGIFKGTDSCCRAHDNCPSSINPGESKGPLINNGIFTRSACSCDSEFYNCLKNVSSIISANIGITYFNILRPQCFSYDYPIESCAEYSGNLDIKCVKYNFDTSQPKTLEWFDNPSY